ncbi:aminoglycoside phosphotransferase family protein [Rossellomorea vietnamensis]|uniref:aminoglycoside phosphotransferase family protein n=1 Tax=Rossellomorea vietnamensis TaxID=218284 RepID=UPI001E4FE104|nr:aminoglycoside phosphotransferase family protein [Rossellomorea vietnamensis]MCC5803606.1 aminoglycoside phosphotransferase family protein [Rossellomorea vietnamensis]
MNKDNLKSNLLERFRISESDFLGSGMEATVYALDDYKVLKIYNDFSDVKKQEKLRGFYAGLKTDHLSYELPYIHDILVENGTLVTIEKRMQGSNMQSKLAGMTRDEQTNMMKIYLQANLELHSLQGSSTMEGFQLFHDHRLSLGRMDNWYDLLSETIKLKQTELKPYFERDVRDYEAKLTLIMERLATGYEGDYSIIHGDFYPGNILINEKNEVTGLIDFGMLTMYGDYLFDVAIGWVCLDMYNQLNASLPERYLDIIVSTLGEGGRKDLYFYVLIYSLMTANLYSPTCEDGHYRWCVENLNREEYWEVT